MKTTMFYLIQVFHQSLLLQMYENNNVLFNSGVSPNFTITDVCKQQCSIYSGVSPIFTITDV